MRSDETVGANREMLRCAAHKNGIRCLLPVGHEVWEYTERLRIHHGIDHHTGIAYKWTESRVDTKCGQAESEASETNTHDYDDYPGWRYNPTATYWFGIAMGAIPMLFFWVLSILLFCK